MDNSDKFNVFIIEDNDVYSSMINYILCKDKTINTMIFDSAEGCLDYTGRKPNLILLDHQLGGMDGLCAMKILKKIHKKVPIVIMSSQDEIDLILEYMGKGATDYIIKNNYALELLTSIVTSIKSGSFIPKKFFKELHNQLK